MNHLISHAGRVCDVSTGCVRVRITQHSACVGCKAAAACNSAESKEKIIEVYCTNAEQYTVGQEVTVLAALSVGMKAVMVGFVFPLVILLIVAVTMLQIGYSEPISALSSIASLIPYYILLYALRNRLGRTLTFSIA